jgi:hypothetical protein
LRSGSRGSGRGRWRATLQLLLEALNLLRKLLISVLQLFDLTGEVAEHALKAIKSRHKICSILRERGVRRERTQKSDHKKRSSPDHSLRHVRWLAERTLASPKSKL